MTVVLLKVVAVIAFILFKLIDEIWDTSDTRRDEARRPQLRESRHRRAQGVLPRIAGRVAAKTRGRVVDRPGSPYPAVRFVIHGFEAEVHWGLNPAMTRVVVNLAGHAPGWLRVHPHEEGILVREHVVGRVIPAGHPAFDRRFKVESDPESLFGDLFSPPGKPPLIDFLRRIPSWWEGHLDLTLRTLTLSIPVCFRMATAVMLAVRAVTELVSRLRDLELAGELEVIEVTQDSAGVCQVCGSPLDGVVIRCARCDTPHHRDCWDYMERCSTFGCDEAEIRIQSGR